MRSKFIAFLGLLCFSTVFAYGQARFGTYALTGVTLIDASRRHGLAHQTVVVKDGKIAQVFADGSLMLPDSVSVIRAGGKYLIPGLIDTHVHMATDPSDVDNRAATLRVLQRMLYSGITTVRDMAGDARVLAGLSRDARVGDILSPDIYYSALMAGPEFFKDPRTVNSTQGGAAGGMPYMLGVTPSTDMPLAVAAARGSGAWGIKLYADLKPEMVNKIVAEAKRQGILVWGHAYLQYSKPSDLVRAGVSSVSHSPLLMYETRDSIPAAWKHGEHSERFWDDSVRADEGLLRSMKDRHVILDATLSAYKSWERQDSGRRYLYQIARRLAAQAYAAGVEVCAGTDDDQEAFVQSEMHLLVHDAGFSAIDALVAATCNGADALGLTDRLGTIEVGKDADLVVLDKNPLEDIDNVLSVHLVIKKGKIYTSSDPTAP